MASSSASCAIDRDIAYLLDVQRRVSWREQNTDEQLRDILSRLQPPSAHTSYRGKHCNAAAASSREHNSNHGTAGQGLAILLSGAARTLDPEQMRVFGGMVRASYSSPIKMFAWLMLTGDVSNAYSLPMTLAEAEHALQGSGLEFELRQHSDNSTLLPPAITVPECAASSARERQQFRKLAAATRMMAIDEERRGRPFSLILRTRPDYCFAMAERFFRAAFSAVRCASPIIYVVHDAVALYPRWAADAVASLGSSGETFTMMSTISSRSVCDAVRSARGGGGGLVGGGRKLPQPAPAAALAADEQTALSPCAPSNPNPPCNFCCSSAEKRRCGFALWRRLEANDRFRCAPGVAAPALLPLPDGFLNSQLTYMQYDALLVAGLFAVDLGHAWPSSARRAGGSLPIAALEHWGVDQIRRSRLWWSKRKGYVNASALDLGDWSTRCANFD